MAGTRRGKKANDGNSVKTDPKHEEVDDSEPEGNTSPVKTMKGRVKSAKDPKSKKKEVTKKAKRERIESENTDSEYELKNGKNSENSDDETVTLSKPSRKKQAKSRTAKKAKLEEKVDTDSEPDRSSKKKAKKENGAKAKPRKAAKKDEEATEVETSTDEKTQVYETKGSMKIVSWNVNGIRAWLPKGGLEYLEKENPDILCVQETKCAEDKLPSEITGFKNYKSYFLAGVKDGYSGVGILTRKEPLKVVYGIGDDKHDSEGRVITLEFDDFFLVNAYVPNAGRGLVRLDYRMDWDKDFRDYLCKLKDEKAVILTGDLNVAHNEIDLKNPKTNKRNAGFTQEERDGLSSLLEKGFIDSFRKLYPDREGAYTFWTYMMNARAKNVGWRLDYFIVSENFIDSVIDNEIRDKVTGSDHCPIVLHLK